MAEEMFRSSAGQVYRSGSITFNDTTGQEYVSITSSHGHDTTFDGQKVSFLYPTNEQKKVGGDSFSDVQGYRTTFTKRSHHIKANGTLSIISGLPRLYNADDETLKEYVQIKGELAAIQCAPTLAVGGSTNNTKSNYKINGSVNPEGGSVEGGNFKGSNIRNKYGDVVLSKASKMIELEQKMGTGGDMILCAAKDVLITAGTTDLPIDSGYVNPNGRQIQKGYKIVDGVIKPQWTSTYTYDGKDTYSTTPFGKIDIVGSNRISFKTGPGGFEVVGTGQVKLVGTGLTHIAGQQVDIVSSGATLIDSKGAIESNAPNFNVNSPESLFQGNVSIKDDVVIGGDLEIAGNLTVYGNIICKQDVTADGDVVASGISLKTHTHGGGPPPN